MNDNNDSNVCCPLCGVPLSVLQVERIRQRGKTEIICNVCDTGKVTIPSMTFEERALLKAQLASYWTHQVSEVKADFLRSRGGTPKRSWRAADYSAAINGYLAALPVDKLQAEADKLTAAGMRWR